MEEQRIVDGHTLFKALKTLISESLGILQKFESTPPSEFQLKCSLLKSEIQKALSESQSKQFTKLLKLAIELIEKSTIRRPMAKVPSTAINYLETELNAHDIHWILKNLKIQWVRFNQFYWQAWFDMEMKKNQ